MFKCDAMDKGVVVDVDLGRVRQNAEKVAGMAGVPVYAVIKADAYGLGAQRVAREIAEAVGGFCVFSLAEARAIGLWKLTGKEAISLGPPETLDAEAWIEQHVRPAVSTVEQARALREARPVLCVDTGMGRFACRAGDVDAVIEAGGIDEAFTHATRLEQARALVEATQGRGLKLHAAGSALLNEPEARLDAVRPGLALYRDAVTVRARLIEVRRAEGPVGYTGFGARRYGVVLCGYARGLRAGECVVNGRRRRIPEVGMQSAYVELGEEDRAGDEVVLLGEGLAPEELARMWGCTAQEVLLRLVAG